MSEVLCHECLDGQELGRIIRGLEKRIAKAYRKNKLSEVKKLKNILAGLVVIADLAVSNDVLLGLG